MRKIKDFVLKKTGITELRNKCKKLEEENRKLTKKYAGLLRRTSALEKMMFIHYKGLNREIERNPRIIVSLTSFPERIPSLPEVLEHLLVQTIRPDKVVLWLSLEQFPNREQDLTDQLLALCEDGLEIEWCEGDIKAYKKILPALKKFPDDLLVIVDDDIIYDLDLIEKLYETHMEFPDAIIASRVHQICFDHAGKIKPYSKWKKECNYGKYETKADWFLTGGAGTLIPPHSFDEEIFNIEVIKEKCPLADDIWININAAMNHVNIVNIAKNNYLTTIAGTQENCLFEVNKTQNDIQLREVVLHYKERLQDTVYNNM